MTATDRAQRRSGRRPAHGVRRLHRDWQASAAAVVAVVASVAACVVLVLSQSGPNRDWPLAALLMCSSMAVSFLAFQVLRARGGVVQIQGKSSDTLTPDAVHLATMEALARAVEPDDRDAQVHIRRVQCYAAEVARAMGLSEPEIEAIETAALLHDIGKIAIPEHILSKSGPLTPEEFQKVRLHPQIGAEIIASVPFPFPVAPIILSHHERWDGGGYPQGLKGEAIPIGARILTAVDYYDAITSDRPYHKALSSEKAVVLMKHEAGKALDPRVVEQFVALLPELLADESVLQPPDVDEHAAVATAPSLPLERALRATFENIAQAHREIYALYEIAQTLGTSLGVADTMALISSKLMNLVPWSACALFQFEEESRTFNCRFAAGVERPKLPPSMLERADGAITRTARTWSLAGSPDRPPFSSADGSRASGQPPATEASQTGLRSAIICPLFSNDAFIGALALYHVAANYYTEDHRRLLERISGQTGAVIHNSIVFERAQEESLTDALTSLPNRRSMFAYLERELARAERMLTEIAVIVMDLDRFKSINDTYGHHVGDHALREMAAALQAALRPYDLCVRYAGDEFVIVITDCSPSAAEAKRVELQQQVAKIELEVRPNQTIRLAASAGAAVFPHDGASCEALLAEADRAMYRDKASRRGGGIVVTTRADGGDERRRHVRVAGPFDGRRIGALETPVLIYDLSEGGCFIIAFHEQAIGRQFLLEIDLPGDGRVTVQAETLYNRPGFGFAVRFLDAPEDTRARIAALVARRTASAAPPDSDVGHPPAADRSPMVAPRGAVA